MKISKSKQFSALLQETYIAGMNDALNIFAAGKQDEADKWIIECSNNKTLRELRTIFNNWLKNRPEYWHWSAATLYVYSLADACGHEADLPPPD